MPYNIPDSTWAAMPDSVKSSISGSQPSLKSMVAPSSTVTPTTQSLRQTVNGQQTVDNYGNADISTQIKNAIMNGADDSTIQGLAQSYENKINSGGANYADVKIRTGADLLKSLNYAPQQAQQATQSQQTMPTLSSYIAPVSPVTDNSALISQQYDASQASALATLRQMIQKNISDQQGIISKAPGTYAPMENTASANGQQNMQNLREMLANQGQQGGVNRTEETQVNANTQNAINSLEMQKQNVIDDANKAITDAQASGNLQEAQIIADTANQKLSALIAESNRIESETYNRGQDTFNNNIKLSDITGNYNGSPTAATTQQNFNNNETLKNDAINATATDKANAANDLQNQIDTIGQYSNNYQAEYNRRQAINPNDPLLPYLAAAHNEKLASQQATATANANAAKAAQTAAGKQQYDNAMAIWKVSGVATADVAKILGIPVGSKTEPYLQNEASNKISQQNANTSSQNANTSAQKANASKVPSASEQRSSTNASQDAAYNTLLTTWRNSAPQDIISSLDHNPQGYIDKIGQSNFNKLYNDAKSKVSKATTPTTNQEEAKVTAILDAMSPTEQNAWKIKNKTNIISQFGLTFYNGL